MRVGILGGGQWGQALARLVLAAGHEPFIAYRDKRPPPFLASSDNPTEVSQAARLLIAATSAQELRHAIQLADPGPEHRVVVAGRGVEPKTGKWLTEVVCEESPVLRVGALAGPASIEEILAGGFCAGVVASAFEEVRSLTQEALHSDRYRLYDTGDLVGVELAGALVPVLASLVGVVDAMPGSGIGLRALVVARGMAEGGRLARAVGGRPDTLTGLAGWGDLFASQCRPGQPSWEAGRAVATGSPTERNLQAAEVLLTMARPYGVDMPLTQAWVHMLGGADPVDTVHQLMRRASKQERL